MVDHDPVYLDATLRPNPPMPPKVLKLALAAVAALNLAFASYFVFRGAWPITPFMGLDVALLAWAFRASVRASKKREHITLTRSRLRVERHSPGRPASEVAFNPYWVRVDIADPADHWSQLTLWSHGRGVRIGSFLAPAERQNFARALKAALRHLRETLPA